MESTHGNNHQPHNLHFRETPAASGQPLWGMPGTHNDQRDAPTHPQDQSSMESRKGNIGALPKYKRCLPKHGPSRLVNDLRKRGIPYKYTDFVNNRFRNKCVNDGVAIILIKKGKECLMMRA